MTLRAIVVAGLVLATAGCASQTNTLLDKGGEGIDAAAQVRLQQAKLAVSTYYSTKGSYDGFDAAAGKAAEPGLDWNDGGDAEGDISIRGVTDDSLVLVTSERGHFGCVAFEGGTQTTGDQDADSADECG